ncbi:transmembrane protein, putative (macronuclear) [Tetrahymena thermophila SB210]|uniref:Transmembrane protein, putative n=1 Tax=Tetrahymena thermophila (strain SB210) TaxID=312017 RepID=W7XJ78_TETTS|nr:transmembrane protein, putative [Tetrahymena thermophila SB210]EWS73924.1 transmembrane protein, putative [Tetrahymena thermophila SB210]|eukprot:XP_012653546.1 transmembrane protein, putative [Tetrahymena thermophila SB210]
MKHLNYLLLQYIYIYNQKIKNKQTKKNNSINCSVDLLLIAQLLVKKTNKFIQNNIQYKDNLPTKKFYLYFIHRLHILFFKSIQSYLYCVCIFFHSLIRKLSLKFHISAIIQFNHHLLTLFQMHRLLLFFHLFISNDKHKKIILKHQIFFQFKTINKILIFIQFTLHFCIFNNFLLLLHQNFLLYFLCFWCICIFCVISINFFSFSLFLIKNSVLFMLI